MNTQTRVITATEEQWEQLAQAFFKNGVQLPLATTEQEILTKKTKIESKDLLRFSPKVRMMFLFTLLRSFKCSLTSRSRNDKNYGFISTKGFRQSYFDITINKVLNNEEDWKLIRRMNTPEEVKAS
tara:strand:+ start:233 stop:610 length:378 start_codon:yes stop_codon:yes gene_type:complete